MRAWTLALLILLLVAGAGRQAWVRSRVPPSPRSAGSPELERLRERRRANPSLPVGGVGDPVYADGLARVASAAAEIPELLESLVRDRGEPTALRIELLGPAASVRGASLLERIAADAGEDEALRIAALAMLPARAGPGTPESLRRIWEDPRPFRGRYHVLAAMGELGRPESVAPLREGLAPQRSLDERAHAAQGLGAFAADPRVREALIAVVAGDPEPAVRGAAIRSLAKAPAPDAVAALDRLRTLPWQDPETRRLLDLVRASVAPR